MTDRSQSALIAALSRPSPAGAHCGNRLFEWAATAMMLGIAVCIFITPDTIRIGAFRLMTEAGLTAGLTTLLFATFGALRIIALYANGHWQPWGAWARGLGAITAAFLWFQMGLALLLLTKITGTLSVGIPVYAVLTIGELVSCYRAASDEIRRS